MQMGWLGHRLDDFKAPSVLQRRNSRARIGHFGRIDLGHDYPRLGAAFRNNTPPGVNDQ